jgi:endoglucanase
MEYNFWVNDFDRVKDHKKQFPGVEKIFDYPMAFWYGERNGKGSCGTVHKSLTRLLNRALPELPVFVVYNLPGRDMGHYSKGGASDRENYLIFLESFCQAIGEHPVILIFEPDAIPHSTLMESADAEWRLSLMREGLELITSRCAARVYVDVGHSNWLEPEIAGKLLNSVTNDKVAGFCVNVSNFRSTKESVKWSLRVSEHADNKHFVIDTSRNGNGPYGNEWCNPPGRSLGTPPTTDTGEELCDAFLWIKVPGESDGRGNGGPRAGRFWPEYASELVENTQWLNN